MLFFQFVKMILSEVSKLMFHNLVEILITLTRKKNQCWCFFSPSPNKMISATSRNSVLFLGRLAFKVRTYCRVDSTARTNKKKNGPKKAYVQISRLPPCLCDSEFFPWLMENRIENFGYASCLGHYYLVWVVHSTR